MKLVINKCYGGFSLSPAAVRRYAELQGRPCYFFSRDFKTRALVPVDPDTTTGISQMMLSAFDIPNPNEALGNDNDWYALSMDDRKKWNELYEKHSISSRPDNRACPLLLQVVEELGDAANGACAKLAIVEIPDGIQWEIDEYDGIESVQEVHRSWS